MIYRILLQLALFRAVISLSLPTTLKEYHRQLIGSASLIIATSLPISAHAVEVIKIDVDIPALIQLAKDNKDLALQLAKQTAGAVKISDYPKSYSNVLNFARDVAAGDVFVEINGYPIDVSLLSEKGAIDVDLSTEVGDVSVTVSSDILPKLPFLSKRVVPMVKTAVDTSNSESTADPPKIVRTRAAAAIRTANEPKGSILDRPFFLDPFQQGWTVKQVLGSTSLGLGIAYASSYAYYIKSQEDEENAAAEKKKNAAANKAVVKVDKSDSKPAKAEVIKVETKAEVEKADNVSTERTPANAELTPIEEKKSTAAEATAGTTGTDQTQKSGGLLRFWKKDS